MSLTSHLEHAASSPIGRFLRQRFPHTARLTKEANLQLRATKPLLPPAHLWPYSQIGMALDYRIRYSFALTPLHQLVAWQGAWLLLDNADQFKMSTLMLEQAGYAPFPDLEANRTRNHSFYTFEVIHTFFLLLEETLSRLQPIGRLLEVEEERQLGRLCFLLGLFEVPFRSGRFDGPLFVPAPRPTLDALLAIPQSPWLDDLCALSRLFCSQHGHLLSRSHVLNPVFAGSRDVGGADADLIVDGCLIDIKTTKQSSIEADWIRQIAGYLLLDYDDRYQVQSVGLYLARHGMLLGWPVSDFVRLLTNDPNVTIAGLREEFRHLIGIVKSQMTAQPPTA